MMYFRDFFFLIYYFSITFQTIQFKYNRYVSRPIVEKINGSLQNLSKLDDGFNVVCFPEHGRCDYQSQMAVFGCGQHI